MNPEDVNKINKMIAGDSADCGPDDSYDYRDCYYQGRRDALIELLNSYSIKYVAGDKVQIDTFICTATHPPTLGPLGG